MLLPFDISAPKPRVTPVGVTSTKDSPLSVDLPICEYIDIPTIDPSADFESPLMKFVNGSVDMLHESPLSAENPT
jgi:hypothetical protein